MQQKQLTLLKHTCVVLLMLSTGFGCKKSGTITPPPVVPPAPPPVAKPEPLGLIPIKAGSFIMGSVGYDDDENPMHAVTLSAFYLDSTELTRKKFLPFLQSKDTSYVAVNQRRVADYDVSGSNQTDEHPIVNISWFTAVAYCNWLTKEKGNAKDTCYSFLLNGDGTINTVIFDRNKKGYRLPTEAEWEYACRAETVTKYSCGDGVTPPLIDYAWYTDNALSLSHPVGLKKPNSFGLYDMHGNVREWCYDFYGDYTSKPQNDPTGSNIISPFRISRGGSWLSDAASLRSAFRVGYTAPSYQFTYIGFRLAKTM